MDIFERTIQNEGHRLIAGVDEAGRGPLAGPVVAAAVVFESANYPQSINDSKLLSTKQREKLFSYLQNTTSIYKATGIVEAAEIDHINILQASLKAMNEALSKLEVDPDFVIVDGNKTIPQYTRCPQRAIIAGDKLSYSIAASSIIAKVIRDRIMDNYDKVYPQYAFRQHKGYPTRLHIELLKKHGPCPIHRKSYAPVRNSLTTNSRRNQC